MSAELTETSTAVGLTAFDGLLHRLSQMRDVVAAEVKDLPPREQEHALSFLIWAYDLAVEMWFEKGDPASPEFTSWEHPWRKYGGDNPGTIYLSAPVAPGHQYRITGHIGDALYCGVQVYGKAAGYNAPTANISAEALQPGNDGAIALLVGGERPAAGEPWLPLAGGDYVLMVRLYHYVPPTSSPDFSIERVDSRDLPPLAAEERARTAADYFREEVLSTTSVTNTLRDAGVNRYTDPNAPVHQPKYTGALFPTRDNAYDGFFLDLAPGQALRVTGRLTRARYTSFVFYDRWFNTPDYRAYRCYLNDRNIVTGPGGTYEIILGPDDPHHPNWIDTAGLTQGIFAVRYLLPESRALPDVEIIQLNKSS